MLLKQILSLLLALIVICLGGLLSIVAMDIGGMPSSILEFFTQMQGSLEYVILFLAVTMLGVLYFAFNFLGKSQPTSILVNSDLGEVRISLESIDSLVHQSVKTIKGIKDMKTRIVIRDGGLFIYVKAVLYGDRNIPELSEQMQGTIQDHVYNISGVNVSEVKVLVENVATDIKARVS